MTTVFNFFNTYLYTSLSLPIFRLAHSSPTVMYQENLQHEKAGLDIVLYFCSYHGEKSQLGCVPLIQFSTMYGHFYSKQRTDKFSHVQTQSDWNNQRLIPSRYSHKPNLCKATPSLHAGKTLDFFCCCPRFSPEDSLRHTTQGHCIWLIPQRNNGTGKHSKADNCGQHYKNRGAHTECQ